MATVLLTWELGLGIGHLMNLRAIGLELLRRGHRVVAALRDLSRTKEIFGDADITFIQAPYAVPRAKIPFDPPKGWVHLLGNNGFSGEQTLGILFNKWNAICDHVSPDLVVVDHSPTVLLALRGRPIPRVNIGLAFFCPPDVFPLPFWAAKDMVAANADKVMRDEEAIVVNVNRLLTQHQRPKIQQLSQLFNEIDEVFLATYREFDHFGARPGTRYWGHWPFGVGVKPVWPKAIGPKIYCYLNPSPELEMLLQLLVQLGHPTIVVPAKIGLDLQARYTSPTLRFEPHPLDLQQVGLECDVAVTNAGHGTVATLLLAGKPCFLVALSMEQLLFARTVEGTGSGCIAAENPSELPQQLNAFLASPHYRGHARTFATRYSGWTPGQQVPEIVDRLDFFIASKHTKY